MCDSVEVSVIVPVRNRRHMLGQLLGALDAQTFQSFEVVVVDDGSSDGTDEVAATAMVAGRAVVLLRSDGRGSLHARQYGVDHSQGSILAFTDSDCLPEPQWLAAAAAALAGGADMVNGCTRPTRPLRPMERSVASGTEGLYPSCNIFFRRTVYTGIGGFDAEHAKRWRLRLVSRHHDSAFGEDTLLAWQVIRSGASARYVADAVVHHQVFAPDARDFFIRTAKAAAFPAMISDLPELRPRLLKGHVFLGGYERVPFYVALLALVLRRRRWALGAVAWWTLSKAQRSRRSPYPTMQVLPWLPVEMAVDVATAVALMAGSVNARTVVL